MSVALLSNGTRSSLCKLRPLGPPAEEEIQLKGPAAKEAHSNSVLLFPLATVLLDSSLGCREKRVRLMIAVMFWAAFL